MKPLIKYIKYTIISFFILLFLCINLYLFSENLFIYSHASNDIAILQIRWGMSPKEVEIVTEMKFESEDYNNDEHKTFTQRIRIIDRARKSEVKYYFYDNQLYKINIKKGINLFKTKIIEQLLDKAFLTDQKVDIINTLHNNNKYRIDQNNRLILIYLDDLNLEVSKNINLAMGYKPLVEKLNEE